MALFYCYELFKTIKKVFLTKQVCGIVDSTADAAEEGTGDRTILNNFLRPGKI